MKYSIFYALPFMLFFEVQTNCQSNKLFKVSGDLGFTTEFYNFSANDSTLQPRRPDFNYRLFFNPVFQFGKFFSLPVSLSMTKSFENAYLSLPSYNNPLRRLTNPNNDIGLHPTLGWATVHLGSHTADFSELSTGNLPIFGVGFDIQPGIFRLAYSYGVTTWSIQPDSTIDLQGVFRRRFQALKVGVGKNKNFFYLNTTKVRDDERSIKNNSTPLKPQEGALLTAEAGLAFTKHISGNAEFGVSAFTKNGLDEKVEGTTASDIPDFIFTARQSSQLDLAYLFSLNIDYPEWGITFRQKKLGAGYKSLGFGYVETDILDRTVSPRLQLFNNKFILNGSIGQRRDNLSGTKATTTKRLIVSSSLMTIFSKTLSLTANYVNYGTRNNFDNDTLRLEFVSRNLSITPVYRIQGQNNSHTFSATYALSDFDDKNLFSGELATNRTQTLSSSYTLGIQQFLFNASATRMKNNRSTGALSITTISLRPSYRFLKGKLNASASFVYALISHEGFTDAKRYVVRPQLRWRVSAKLTFKLSGSLHTYRYGSIRNNAMYDESYLKTGITTMF